jgi:5-methyltetrahydrofolate--homocysteine methyltransferase
MKTFSERLEDSRPLIFDGGFGSELFARGIELANSTLANELYPDVVVDIHSDYIEAGANAIGTNTFVAAPAHLEMAGREASEVDNLVRRAVQLAKEAVERSSKEVYIAGSMGPLPGAIEADSGDTEFGIPNQSVRDSQERLATILAEEGVDFFCFETMFSAKEAAIGVDMVRKFGIPIAVNLTYKFTQDRKTGEVIYKTDWGHTATDLLATLSGGEFSDGYDLLDVVQILGLNCGAEAKRKEHTGMAYAVNGIRQLAAAMEKLGIHGRRMMAYPNAGIAHLDENRRTYYSQTPEEMGSRFSELLDAGAYFIGGCCGTGPAHIRAFREALNERIASMPNH